KNPKLFWKLFSHRISRLGETAAFSRAKWRGRACGMQRFHYLCTPNYNRRGNEKKLRQGAWAAESGSPCFEREKA
ncbi:hypothetical protein OB13_01785, partial [Pontibacter sp. HJ8]